MNDNKSLFIALGLAAMASLATAADVSRPERRGFSTQEEGNQLHQASTARVCLSDSLPPIDSEATLQAVINVTFEGTYSGEACWLDAELLHRTFVRQQPGRLTPMNRHVH
jgi:heat shock protein HslJ